MNHNATSVQTFINIIKTFKFPSCQVTTGQVLNAGTILTSKCSKTILNKIKHCLKSNKKRQKETALVIRIITTIIGNYNLY